MDTWESLTGALSLDAGGFPLVLSTVRHVPSADEMKGMLMQIGKLLGREKPYVLVAESQLADPLPYALLKLEADWHKKNAGGLSRYCLGVGLVVREISPSRTFAASTVKSMSGKAAVPMQVFTDRDQAKAWALHFLEQRKRPGL